MKHSVLSSRRGIRCCRLLFFSIFLLLNSSRAKAIITEGIGRTQETAKRNAMRNAVEQGIGMQISSQTIVKNFTLISDNILSNTDGYVSSCKILSAKHEFGMVKVKISAEVTTAKLRDDLVAQKLLYEMKNKPRIMVILEERIEREPMFEKTATHIFEKILLKRGFKIVEPEQLEKVIKKEKMMAMDNKDLAFLGFRQGADIIIRGKVFVAKSTPKKIYGQQFYSVPVQMNAHVVRADNAVILATRTKRVRKNSQDAYSAGQFGLEIGGKSLANQLLNDLMQYWRSEAYNDNTVELIVAGLDNRGLKSLETKLQGISFITGVRLRYMEEKSALYDIELRGSVQDLRHIFGKKELSDVQVNLVTANRIGVVAKKAGTAESTPVSYTYTGPDLGITRFKIDDIFPSRVRYYESHPLAKVQFTCSGKRPVSSLKVSVIIPEVMDLPGEIICDRIAPEKAVEKSLNLMLNSNKVLANKETRTVYGQVTVTFIENGKETTRKLTAPVKIFDANTMDWMIPESIGGFITYRSSVIDKFARNALHAVPDNSRMNTEMKHAVALFQSLHVLGIRYVKDPSGSPGTRLLDRVQYPPETLEKLGGDCDDTSVLYAALLSAVGVNTAIISYPDHVLTMFDTGIFAKNRYSLSIDSSMSIVHNGTLWIPVETTLIAKGFLEAWKTAAEEFHRAVAEGQRVAIIDLSEAWKEYETVSYTRESAIVNKVSSQTVIKELQRVQHDLDNAITTEIKRLGQKGTLSREDQNRLGVLHARAGNYVLAVKQFEKLSKKQKQADALNNLGCALILSGNEDAALNVLSDALQKERSAGIAVNKALCLYLKSNTPEGMEQFILAMNDAGTLLPEGESLDKLLGIDLGESNKNVRASEKQQKQTKQTIDKRRLKELIRQRVLGRKLNVPNTQTSDVSTKANIMPFGGIRGADPEQVAKIVELLYWYL